MAMYVESKEVHRQELLRGVRCASSFVCSSGGHVDHLRADNVLAPQRVWITRGAYLFQCLGGNCAAGSMCQSNWQVSASASDASGERDQAMAEALSFVGQGGPIAVAMTPHRLKITVALRLQWET